MAITTFSGLRRWKNSNTGQHGARAGEECYHQAALASERGGWGETPKATRPEIKRQGREETTQTQILSTDVFY